MPVADVISIARNDIGYTECVGPASGCPKRPQTPGCNHTIYGRRFGMNAQPWCAIYTWDLWTRAGYGNLIPKTAGAWDMLTRAHAKGWAIPPQMPRVGDIPVYNLGDGHIGGVVTGVRASGFTAIEGNTSRGNTGSQTNGWYVAERFRTVPQLRGLIRLPVTEDDMPITDADLDAIAKRVWTIGWPAPTPDNPQRVEAAQDRLLAAARGGGLADDIAALSRTGTPVALTQAQIDGIASAVMARLAPAVAAAVSDELARRLQT